MPLVTVLTPVYNGAAFIARTIESILTQNYSRLQYRELLAAAYAGMARRCLRYVLGTALHV